MSDLTGNKYNMLTALEKLPKYKRNLTYYRCLCDCGNEKIIEQYKLTKGYTRSCGCLAKQAGRNNGKKRTENLIGNKFNRLLVLENIENYNNTPGTHFKCLCDCGNITFVRGNYLKSGTIKSCGCLQREVASETMSKNVVGNKYSRLYVIEKIKHYNGGKSSYYKCLCDCGNTTVVRSDRLASELTKSCGCLQREWTGANFKDLTNQKFNKLIAIERLPKYKNGITYYRCLCDCGNYTIVNGSGLEGGRIRSCGCLRNETLKKLSGENNSQWRGGKNVVWYDTYSHQLEPIEETRRDPENSDYLQVKCVFCENWFEPTKTQVVSRLASINGKSKGENRLYCSKECKQSCPIFGRIKFLKGHAKTYSREVQPELRKMTLERDNYECQRCGSKKLLHCHHIEPISQNPLESADLDNCIILCKKCHEEVHSQEGCTYSELRCNNKETNHESNV